MNDSLDPFSLLKRPLPALLAACALAGCELMPDMSSIQTAAEEARSGQSPRL